MGDVQRRLTVHRAGGDRAAGRTQPVRAWRRRADRSGDAPGAVLRPGGPSLARGYPGWASARWDACGCTPDIDQRRRRKNPAAGFGRPGQGWGSVSSRKLSKEEAGPHAPDDGSAVRPWLSINTGDINTGGIPAPRPRRRSEPSQRRLSAGPAAAGRARAALGAGRPAPSRCPGES